MNPQRTETLHLTGIAWRPWADLRTALADCHCLWADLDGMHYEPQPPDAHPVGTTHLWGWIDDRWFRVRLDTAEAAASVLHRQPVADSAPVPVVRHHAEPWGLHYQRTAPWGRPAELLVVGAPVPLTFIARLLESPA